MINRRGFLAALGGAGLAVVAGGAAKDTLRAVVIGDTGHGDYGHGMDTVFSHRPGIEVVAVADPDQAARARALVRIGAARAYANWQEMLEREKPHLVSIAPRQTRWRHEMLLGALHAGAHVACEKPFVRCPADADAVLALAGKMGKKIAVMHQMRLAPAAVHLAKKVAEGMLGELVEMRAWGKQDKRAGGEDLVVLGVHLFDLMRLFAGDPRWCTARVLEKGRPATLADARPASEDIGPVLGDQIDAQFSFANGILGTFTSRAALREQTGHWGIELVGSKASARILADIWPSVVVKKAGNWSEKGRDDLWRPLGDDPAQSATAQQRSVELADARVIDDFLRAVESGTEPACSGVNGAKAVEMVMSIWRAGLTGGRVELPLAERAHPLPVSPGRDL